MKASVFTHELSKTSAVFGRKHDVSVVFQGDGAATNGSTIILPALNLNADVSEEQAAIMRGYVDHEAGHVRHTDFSVLANHAEELKANKLLHSCANALEDIWLEQRVRSEYPGSEANIKATADAVNREFLEHVKPEDERLRDPVWVGPVAATWIGRQTYVPETTKQCIDMLDDELRQQVSDMVERVSECKNSWDVLELAREFESAMRKGKAEREEEKAGEKHAGKDEGDDADSEMGDSGRGDEGDAPEGDSGGSGTSVEADDADDTGDSAADGAKSSDDGVEEGDQVYDKFDLSEGVKRGMSEVPELVANGHDDYRAFSTAHDKWHHRLDARNKYGRSNKNNLGHYLLGQGSADTYTRVLGSMSGTINSMRRKMERALIAKQTRDWDIGREEGRLDTRRLTSAVAGRTNVFKVRTPRAEMDTALMVLIDLSGSMYRNNKIQTARQVAIAVAESIDRAGVTYEVLGFCNATQPEGGYTDEHRSSVGDYARVEPLDMLIFKAFHERLYEAKGAMAQIVDACDGNNTDGEAVELAYERLMQRPEKRKVFLVLSDGYPQAAGDSSKLHRHLRSVVAGIEREKRADLVGIGIQSSAVERFYSKHVVVNDVSDLSGVVMDQLAKLLLGERFVVDNSKLIKHAV